MAEHAFQVEDMLNRCPAACQGQWIALGPSAIWALSEKKIPHSIPEDFYSFKELDRYRMESRPKIENICRHLDMKLWSLYPGLKATGMQPFLFSIAPLIIICDTLASRIFRLQAVIAKYPGRRIWVHKAPGYSTGRFGAGFSNQDNLWANILTLPGWNADVKFIKEPIDASLETKSPGANIRKIIKRSFFLNNLAANFISGGLAALIKAIFNNSGGALLLRGSPYEWRHVIPALREKGWKIVFTDESVFRSGRKAVDQAVYLKEAVMNDQAIKEVFSMDNISFYPLISERLERLSKDAVSLCQLIDSKIGRVIKEYKIRAVLASSSPTLIDHAIEQASRRRQIPVIHWQHGFITHINGKISQLNKYSDMMTSDGVLTFGDEVVKAYKLHTDDFPVSIIPVGSATLDRIYNIRSRAAESFNKKILYITTRYYQNSWYGGIYNDNLFYIDQLAIMNGLEYLRNRYSAEVTVKLAPGKLCIDPPFMSKFNSIFRVVKDSPTFTELLSENHIIIIDTPTTKALEAVVWPKPVFILTGHIPYPKSGFELLAKRSILADDPEELLKALTRYIETKAYPASVANDDYLRAYGIYLGDGKSAERAVEAVLKLIGEKTDIQ